MLVDGIKLKYDSNSEYNLVEVLIDFDNTDVSDVSSSKKSSIILPTIETPPTIMVSQIIEDSDILDKLCTLCIGNKSIKVVIQNKSMTVISNKLEEVHANLWGLYNPPLQSRSTYVAIIICEYMRKT